MNAERRHRTRHRLLALLAGLVLPALGEAASLIIVDPAAEGFTDGTAAAPAAGNPGKTLGEQRLYVFRKAAEQWGHLIDSPVPIRIDARMSSLPCGRLSAVLGAAGPNSSYMNFPNAPRKDTWFVEAEANALSGTDQDPKTDDIQARFNINLDRGDCLMDTAGWWYGVDPSVPVPKDRVPLLPVVFHELAHGLGFLSLTDAVTGQFCCGTDAHPDIWAHFLYDTRSSKSWSAMDDDERRASAVDDPHLVWAGTATNRVQRAYLKSAASVRIAGPGTVAGDYPARAASFAPPPPRSGITREVVLADDGVAGKGRPAGTVHDGCEPLVNGAEVTGKIALIERGFCAFTVKAKNAQLAGAVGVLIANRGEDGEPAMGGKDESIAIPTYGISRELDRTLRVNARGLQVTLGSITAATESGCVRLYAPRSFEQGSSVSHFSTDANPPLLMMPNLNDRIFDKVDLTIQLFKDIGWHTHADDLLSYGDFEDNPCALAHS